jgi:hypothetical protein
LGEIGANVDDQRAVTPRADQLRDVTVFFAFGIESSRMAIVEGMAWERRLL